MKIVIFIVEDIHYIAYTKNLPEIYFFSYWVYFYIVKIDIRGRVFIFFV